MDKEEKNFLNHFKQSMMQHFGEKEAIIKNQQLVFGEKELEALKSAFNRQAFEAQLADAQKPDCVVVAENNSKK